MSKFQYILCYGSSTNADYQVAMLNGFQYILCYGSSNSIKKENGLIV